MSPLTHAGFARNATPKFLSLTNNKFKKEPCKGTASWSHISTFFPFAHTMEERYNPFSDLILSGGARILNKMKPFSLRSKTAERFGVNQGQTFSTPDSMS